MDKRNILNEIAQKTKERIEAQAAGEGGVK